MDQNVILSVGQDALRLIVYLSGPLLLAALIVGLVVGVFQAATQIQEQTLSFIPKLLGMVVALIVLGPWMVQLWLVFTRELVAGIPTMIG